MLLACSASGLAFANEEAAPETAATSGPSWVPFVEGGYVHQFKTDFDDGSQFDTGRLFIQGGTVFPTGPQRRVSLAIGFGRDHYNFSGDAGFASLRPWGRINQLQMSAPVNWAVDEKWRLFFIPTLRSFGESGADFGDSLTGGALAGFSYRFSDKLSIGPGLGVLSQLEDSVNVFPILLLDWKITDRLSLTTGRGLAATQGPGLSLNYRASDSWNLALGGRYESLRFRLDDSGSAAKGVGEDRAFPLFVSATYNRGRSAKFSIVGGAELGGELSLEDSSGNEIDKESYDTSPFLGFTFNLRF